MPWQSLTIQQGFSKLHLVNLISKDTLLVFSISYQKGLNEKVAQCNTRIMTILPGCGTKGQEFMVWYQ